MELNEKIREKQMSENFILGIMLALTGGFLDAYTYITRGGVFANAQTGNIVLMGINLAKGDFERVIHYVVPILAFALGILLSEIIKATLKKKPSHALEADCCFGRNNNSCSVRLYSKRQGQHVCKRYGIVCVFSSGGNL